MFAVLFSVTFLGIKFHVRKCGKNPFVQFLSVEI